MIELAALSRSEKRSVVRTVSGGRPFILTGMVTAHILQFAFVFLTKPLGGRIYEVEFIYNSAI